MWLSLAITLLTWLMSPKGTDAEKRKALLNAAVAGGASYIATEYTDWGKDLSNSFDSAIGVGGASNSTQTAVDAADTSGIRPASGSTWDKIRGWIPGAVALTGTAAVASGSSKWLWLAAAAIGIILIAR